jgi:hypothetical protein
MGFIIIEEMLSGPPNDGEESSDERAASVEVWFW